MKARVRLASASPILFNRMPEATLEGLRTKVKQQRVPDLTREQEAEPKLYTDDDGNIGITAEMMCASLKGAGRDVPFGTGRSKVSTATSTKLFGFFGIEQVFLPFEAGFTAWVPDVRRGKNPNGGEAVCLCRPKINIWALEFDVWYDENLVRLDTIESLFTIAGRTQGLGDFRPNCGGPFGRFRVESIVDVDESDVSSVADSVSSNGKQLALATS